ncbi:MAG: DnaJ domain-containing protein [Bacteroidales bacterium]
MDTSHYYKILDVPENAGIREIKNAFRRKAKAYHPDINKSEEAHELFININEAYTYIMNLHTRDSYGTSGRTSKGEYYRQWMEKERQKARQRAARRARMRFEEFRKSSIYKTTNMLSHMLDYFLLFLGFFVIIAAGIGLYSQGLYITDNGEEIFNFKGVLADIVITVAGLLFIFTSLSNIKSYREKFRRV